MTDLISSLADSIVGLINASPRSPTKEQIEEVIQNAVGGAAGAAAGGLDGLLLERDPELDRIGKAFCAILEQDEKDCEEWDKQERAIRAMHVDCSAGAVKP